MPRVIIIGGGIAGLASGIAFSNAGWDVAVLERAAQIEPMGAGLSLWPNACAAMGSLVVLNAVSASSAPILAMLLADRNGNVLLERKLPGPALMTTRTALQDALLTALGPERVRLAATVKQVASNRIELSGGDTLACDLVIDAGGIRAPSSGEAPRYAGYGGVLALSDPVEGTGLDGLAAEYWGEHERFGVFELPGARRYWFFMRTQPLEAPMPSLAHCMSASANYPPSVSQALAATPENALIPFAVHAKPPPRKLTVPGVVRVGDAAHAMEPNLGQGACQALEDAAALRAIAGHVPVHEIGDCYQRLRLKRARMFVRESRLGKHGAHGSPLAQWMMRAILTSIPSSVSEARIRGMQTLPDYRSRLWVGARC